MILYLVKMTLCASLLYIIYSLLLERENMHRLKRMYLLLSLVFSMTVSFIPLGIVTSQQSLNLEAFHVQLSETKSIGIQSFPTVVLNQDEEDASNKPSVNYSLIILSVYSLVMSIFFFRLLKNSFQMLASARNKDSIPYLDAKIVLTAEKLVPHSFWKCIFINQNDYHNGMVAQEIINHELAHVRQKHSLDVLFIEVLIAIFWFNPIFYLYRNKMKLNHEFLADEAVIKENNNIPYYQNLLIRAINQEEGLGLTSSFNYLITKKRLIMMTRTTSKQRALCKIIALIPVFFVAICFFSSKTIAKNGTSIPIEKANEVTSSQQDVNTQIIPGQGVSSDLINEYQKIIDKYVESKSEDGWKWKTQDLSEQDQNRLYIIYVQMSESQRNDQNIWLVGPLTRFTSAKPRYPNKDEWRSAKNAAIIWLDGEKVDRSALTTHNRQDFVFFTNNFIDTKKEVFQSVLWTKKGYEVYQEKYGKQISVSKLMEIKPQMWFIWKRTETDKKGERVYILSMSNPSTRK